MGGGLLALLWLAVITIAVTALTTVQLRKRWPEAKVRNWLVGGLTLPAIMLVLAVIVPDDDPGMMSNIITILLAMGAAVVTPFSLLISAAIAWRWWR